MHGRGAVEAVVVREVAKGVRGDGVAAGCVGSVTDDDQTVRPGDLDYDVTAGSIPRPCHVYERTGRVVLTVCGDHLHSGLHAGDTCRGNAALGDRARENEQERKN